MRTTSYKKVGEAFKKARIEKGLTLWDIAKRIEEQFNTVERIENGGAVYAHHVGWIKELLGVDVLQILEANKNGEGSHEEKAIEKEFTIGDLI